MKAFVQMIAIRQRRHLLIICFIFAVSAFIISYINLNGMTYFTHKLENRETHTLSTDSKGNPTSQMRSSSNEFKTKHAKSQLWKVPMDKVIRQDNFYEKLRKSFNNSINVDKIREKSKELKGNIEKQQYLFSKAYKDILQRSKQIQNGVDEHTGHVQHSAKQHSRNQMKMRMNLAQKKQRKIPVDKTLPQLKVDNAIVSEVEVLLKNKEQLQNEIERMSIMKKNEAQSDRKDTSDRKESSDRKKISDTHPAADREDIRNQKEMSDHKAAADGADSGITSAKGRDMLLSIQEIDQPVKVPLRNVAPRDTMKIFEGHKAPPIKFTREEPPSDGLRPESCDGCMNLNFNVLLSPKNLCKRQKHPPELLLLIASAPSEELSRTAVRQSWGKLCNHKTSSVACVFMVASSTDSVVNRQVLEEGSRYQDIVMFNFMDAYRNLTYKTIMGLKWAQKYCSEAKFVMKTDQDVYVNTRQIPILLRAAPTDHFSGGYCWGYSVPNRDFSQKWSVHLSDYAAQYFPKMCSGTGYILSKDVVSSILEVSPNIPFVYLEDVYVALCLQKLRIIPTNLSGFNNMRTEFDPCSYRYSVMTSHQISEADLIDYWELTNECPPSDTSPEMLYSPLHLEDLI